MIEQFEQFIKERQYICNVSPRTVEWYRESFKWLDKPEPTQDELKSFVIRTRLGFWRSNTRYPNSIPDDATHTMKRKDADWNPVSVFVQESQASAVNTARSVLRDDRPKIKIIHPLVVIGRQRVFQESHSLTHSSIQVCLIVTTFHRRRNCRNRISH